MIILDTNVLSELLRPHPSTEVIEWIFKYSTSHLFTTTVTQAEILYGVGLMPQGKRRMALRATVDAMFGEEFMGRILPFDSEAAKAFASIACARRALGRPIGDYDAQIAAIAQVRGATLATRNVSDFEECGIIIHNPWAGK